MSYSLGLLPRRAQNLLLDEPTGESRDLSHQALMLKLVRDQCAQTGAAAIVITHDLNLAADICGCRVLLKGGQVVCRRSASRSPDRSEYSKGFTT